MKKLISRKTYNTGTARRVAIRDDLIFSKVNEILYMSPRKDYFIVGSGPENSRWNGKEDLIAVDIEAAIYWLKSLKIKYRNRNGILYAKN